MQAFSTSASLSLAQTTSLLAGKAPRRSSSSPSSASMLCGEATGAPLAARNRICGRRRVCRGAGVTHTGHCARATCAPEIASVRVTPRSAMSRSISVASSLMACRTPSSPTRGSGEQERPADKDEVRTQRQRLQNVRPPTNATVDHYPLMRRRRLRRWRAAPRVPAGRRRAGGRHGWRRSRHRRRSPARTPRPEAKARL